MSDPDEQYGRALFRPLADVPGAEATDAPAAPPRIDLARARTVGRRRRRTRQAATAATLAAVAVLAGATAPALVRSFAGPVEPPTADVLPELPGRTDCTLTELPSPPGVEVEVTGGDPALRHLVGLDRNQNQVYVWRDGKIIGTPGSAGSAPELTDVNDSGLAVGRSGNGAWAVTADGRAHTLADSTGGIAAVNDKGTIASSAGDGYSAPAAPATWSSPTGKARKLPLPDGVTKGEAVDIAEDGTVLGVVGEDGAPYLWRPDGTGAYLPEPRLPGRDLRTLAPVAIRGNWVVGHTIDGVDGKKVAVVLDRAAGTYREVPGAAGRSTDVAADGSVTVDGPAVLIRPDGEHRTVPAVVAGRPITGMTASVIAADGRSAAGRVVDDQDSYHPVVWTCG